MREWSVRAPTRSTLHRRRAGCLLAHLCCSIVPRGPHHAPSWVRPRAAAVQAVQRPDRPALVKRKLRWWARGGCVPRSAVMEVVPRVRRPGQPPPPQLAALTVLSMWWMWPAVIPKCDSILGGVSVNVSTTSREAPALGAGACNQHMPLGRVDVLVGTHAQPQVGMFGSRTTTQLPAVPCAYVDPHSTTRVPTYPFTHPHTHLAQNGRGC